MIKGYIRKANIRDLEQIMIIIYQAVKQLHDLNINQWQDGYPNELSIKDDIYNNSGYVYILNNDVIGYFYLTNTNEPTYNKIDGQWLSNTRYMTIHRFVVNSNYQRMNVASNMLKYIIDICLKNKYNIRIDTHKDNVRMKRLLTKNNFIYCGEIVLLDNSLRNAYELELR